MLFVLLFTIMGQNHFNYCMSLLFVAKDTKIPARENTYTPRAKCCKFSALCHFVLAVSLRTTTRGEISRQHSLFQINLCFTNKVIPSDEVIIHDSDFEIFDNRNASSELEHSEKERQKYFVFVKG